MKCTACRAGNLVSSFLDGLFRCHACDNCGGHWILIEDYIRWKEQHPEPVFAEVPMEKVQAEDTLGALICPVTGGLMSKFQISQSTPNRIDYSPRVGGVWLNKGEWEMLVAEGLAGNLNAILTDRWQQRIRQEKASESFENLYRGKFGHDDYQKACEVRDWLHNHPQKADLRAFLMAHNPFSAVE